MCEKFNVLLWVDNDDDKLNNESLSSLGQRGGWLIKKHVDPEDKLTRRFADSGQNREMYIINESGMYDLVFGSKLPTAKKINSYVLPEGAKC